MVNNDFGDHEQALSTDEASRVRYLELLPEPSNIQATDELCNGDINLSWEWYETNPSGGFLVEWSLDNSSFTTLATTAATARSYTHTISDAANRDSELYYRVRSVNNCGPTSEVETSTTTGIALASPNANPNNVVLTQRTNGVEVSWAESITNENGFKLVRTRTGGGRAEIILDPNTTSYLDTDTEVCESYTYEVIAFNDCGETTSGTSDPISVITDLSLAYEPGFLETSKGYFSDRAELIWTVKDVDPYVDFQKIYRRELGSAVVPQLIATLDGQVRAYDDPRTEAGVLYEYFVVAEATCGLEDLQSYDISLLQGQDFASWAKPAQGVAYGISLRSPVAVVNGNISYGGGIAVPDVRVVAERESGISGTSLSFDGDDRFAIPHSTSLEFEDQFTASLWLKTTTSASQDALFKDGLFEVNIAGGDLVVYINNGSWQRLEASGVIQTGNYYNVTTTYNGSVAILYLNGVEVDRTSITGNLQGHGQPLYLGGYRSDGYDFYGNIDEVRLHAEAMDSITVARTYGRYFAKDEYSLRAYWPMNEGVGPYLFDASNTGGVYNKNDGEIGTAQWSNDIPTSSQLGNSGYTNDAGNYTISGIYYSGTGENFTVTPTITLAGVVHEFDPGNQVVFLGEGNSVQNGVDFEDVSSFQVTGKVVFDYGVQNAGSENVGIYLDGIPVSDGVGNAVQTDENGEFTISVPIGQHVLSFKKGFHDFENDGLWPPDGSKHDFQEDVSGIVVLDQTLRKIAGRVVGGTREGEKPIGFDLSKNNIGQAQFDLVSENGLIKTTITTDANSGEYEVELPPLNYLIRLPGTTDPGIDVVNNPGISFSGLPTLELKEVFAEQIDRDTIYDGTGSVDRIEEYAYHLKQNFIYRNPPQISVTEGTDGLEGAIYLGERTGTFADEEGNEYTMTLTDGSGYQLGMPVYKMAKRYGLKIAVFETYTNYDSGSGVEDVVPLDDATINISNAVGPGYYIDQFGTFNNYPAGSTDQITLSDADGDTTYYFTADEPNLTINESTPAESYTRTLAISVQAGGNTTTWPNPLDASEAQLVYVLGSKGTNTNFITKAPDQVDFILRDPPGSESYAMIESGQSFTKAESMSVASESSVNMNLGVGLGQNTLVGGGICGVGEIFELKAEATVGFNISSAIGTEGEKVETYEFTQSFSTNDDIIDVGADGDLFIGKSENFRYGISDNLELIPAELCGLTEVLCVDGMPSVYGSDGREYKLGRRYGFYLVPDGEPTYFIYSQNHIENYLLPDYITLRNTVLENNPAYVSRLLPEHAHYGANNDDPVWGAAVSSEDPYLTEEEDLDGPSYVFTPANPSDIDSIRWYNQQIRLWKETLAQNEREKVEAINSGVGKENYSISGGAVYNNEKTFTQSGTRTSTFELAMGMSAGASVSLDGYGVSMSMELSAAFERSLSTSSSITEESTITYAYELNDPDVGDFMSVDVYPGVNGNGPVFSIFGGQTMCPHEAEITTKYYQPGTVISNGTLQREKPKIDVAVAEVFNVPADEEAVFTLTLTNESESFDDQLYTLEVVESSNPDGAVLKIDGATFNTSREYLVPGSGAINKTLTMERGPFEYDYEDIKIVIRSLCQYDPTDNDVDITDTVSISAHFLPVCTDVSIQRPADLWTANFESDDTVAIVINDFNVNYAGFEHITLEYKPSQSSIWTPVETFYRDSDDEDALLIPRDNPVITYNWSVKDLPDGNYDLRAYTSCYVPANDGYVQAESAVNSGLIDRVNPHPFGNPSPADGVLSPNDEIMIQFNEPINSGILTSSSFDIRGVLNGGDLRHEAAVHFDGVDDYMQIPEGLNLSRKSFSIDLYVKRDDTNAAVLFSQGTRAESGLEVGFDGTGQVYLSLADTVITSATAIVDDAWHHIAVVYDIDRENAELFIDGVSDVVDNTFVTSYKDQGGIQVAKSVFDESLHFAGYIHELRIWNRALSVADVNTAATKRMARTSRGLLANWQMEEAHGTIAQEKVKLLHADVYGTWQVFPAGKSITFDGSGFAEATSPALSAQQSFTIEFWVKTTDTNASILATGKGNGTDSNQNGWNLRINEAGRLEVHNYGESFLLADAEINDGDWHHVALSCNRLGNINGFVDGVAGNAMEAAGYTGFSGSKLWIGARGWFDGAVQENDEFFTGNLDELRIWNTNRSLTQITQDQYNKLSGNEAALVAYYPGETYVEVGGILMSKATAANQASSGSMTFSGQEFSDIAPNVKLPRPVEKVNFTYSSNGDKVVLSPTDADARIENTILEITVKDIQDLNGNALQYPVTWAAYIDRNQVVWLDEDIRLEKDLGETLTFETRVTNTGGAIAEFTIDNLPSWLSASPASGSVEPLSSVPVTFEVNKGLNIGKYNQDIYLRTDFGYDERLELDLKVYQAPPADWTVNPSDYQYSMSVIAQVMMEGALSRDEDVAVAAIVDGEVRGVAHLEYIAAYDNYQAYLSIYSNVPAGEEVDFYVWNASEGRIHANVTPNFDFESDKRHGTPANPEILEVPDYVRKELQVQKGWQWVSFNLQSSAQADVNTFMAGFDAQEGDLLKGQYEFDQYDPTIGWFGSLTTNGGLKSHQMYKLKSDRVGEFVFEGEIPDPADVTISVNEGWNWISFISQRNMNLNEALAAYDATVGDEIKSQRAFAVYTGSANGWLGSLETLVPGEGYLLHAAQADEFVYPKESVVNGRLYTSVPELPVAIDVFKYPNNMSLIAQLPGSGEDTLIVYHQGEVVGYGLPAGGYSGQQLYFTTIFGNGPHGELEFAALNQSLTPLEPTSDISFAPDQRLGSLTQPVLFTSRVMSVASTQSEVYPNPFTETVTITGDAGADSSLHIELLDVSGRLLGIVHTESSASGAFEITWDGRIGETSVQAGMYFIRVRLGDQQELLRIIKY